MKPANLEILREINRLGGECTWQDMHRKGLHYMTISSQCRWGYLTSPQAYRYLLTDAGRAALKEDEQEAHEK